ncbi:MAG: hypothetical protein SCG72_02940 [Nitrosarchaeum sp.]|nr:hypothetical protein [Nitrosarchaeum sp.]
MVSSVLQPEKIIGKQKPTKEQALKFVSGGSSLGSSVLSGAKNKIVNFDRANVSAKPNNLQALISNLSTSVFNTTNTIQNIFGNKETKEKKSSKFFGGFFDKFKEALAFITFFGAKKNLDRVKENIDNLKTTFVETFDVAKALRKSILKIIEQISGLSGGGGGGGIIGAIMSALGGLAAGLVPGMAGKRAPNVAGPAMKQEGNLLSKIPKGLKGGGGGIGKLLLGGTAALGAGAAVSGLSQPGGEDVQPGDTTPEVPGNVLDKFNSILDRFDKILDGLKGKPGKSSGGNSSSGSSSKPASPGAPPGGSPSPGGAPTGAPSIAGSEEEMLLRLINAESGGQGKLGMAAVGRSVLNRAGLVQSGNISAGQFNAASGSVTDIINATNQYQPVREGKLNRALSPSQRSAALEALNLAKNPELMRQQLRTSGKSESEVNKIMAATGFRAGYAFNDPSQNANVTKLGGHYFNTAGNARMIVPGAQIKPSSTPAPQAPSASKSRPQPIVIPFQQQSQVQPASSGGGGKISAPPSPQQNGPTAPFYPSSNYDNFLTLYSRMVYNIVDG